MPRRSRTKGDIEEKYQRLQTGAGLQERFGGLSTGEVVEAVCGYFCKGHPPAAIRALLQEHLGVTLKREEPWELLTHAASVGRLRYAGPEDSESSDYILDKCSFLRRAKVVRTSRADDVAYHGARMLLSLVRKRCMDLRKGPTGAAARAGKRKAAPPGKVAVHIGFGGGRTLRMLAEAFAVLLSQERASDLPDQIVFHAMIGGSLEGPTANPNAFFSYFADQRAFEVVVDFVGLPAPDLVETKAWESLTRLRAIDESLRQRDKLNIIVTSAGLLDDEHSTFAKMLNKWAGGTVEELRRQGGVGDLLWRPISPDGAVDTETGFRPMTLLPELSDVSAAVQAGVDVLLVAGPCGECGSAKPAVVEAILRMDPPVVTHMVVDSRSVPDGYRPR
jgi:DNA-binding transcriptional regulator LsrR (DeoR family)